MKEFDLYLRNSRFMGIVNLKKKVRRAEKVYLRKLFLENLNQK